MVRLFAFLRDETIYNYAQFVKRGSSDACRTGSRLIVGPWLHGHELASSFDGFDFGQAASVKGARIISFRRFLTAELGLNNGSPANTDIVKGWSSNMPKLKVNGVTLSYKEIGRGNKILLSSQHFFLTDSHMELLGKPPYDYHVYLVTMRGFGESEHVFGQQPEDWTKVWGEDLLAFADAIGAEQFYYTGVSHGTIPGWYAAFHHPHRLKGFVAVSGGVPKFTKPGEPSPVQVRYWEGLVGNREELKKIGWDTPYPTKDPKRLAYREARREEYLEILMNRKKEEFLVDVKSLTICGATTEEEYYDRISKIDAPVMILHGMRDTTADISQGVKAASLIPGAKLVSYEHYEHCTPDECPEPVALECDRFFKDIEGRIL